jgi:hypothetical protein
VPQAAATVAKKILKEYEKHRMHWVPGLSDLMWGWDVTGSVRCPIQASP